MRYTKAQRIADFYARFAKAGFSRTDADALRRIEMTLQRWGERECGDGSNWCIERDEETGKPYNVYHGEGKPRRYLVPDREKGALRRLAKLLEAHPDYIAYHQGDCRGCNVYVIRKDAIQPGEDVGSVYTRGIAACY